LAALDKHKFDLVLMDVQMPEMGGIEATQMIRQKEISTGTHLPIVAMTAHAMSGDRERCLAAGMDGYLAKPLDPRTFLQTVESTEWPGGPSQAQKQEQKVDQPPAPIDGSLNESSLLARFNGNRKLLQSLVKTFLEDCPKMMARIRKAVTAHDAAALADAAHALKGSVGNFGPSTPFETARRMEISARQGTLGGSWEAFATLEDEMASLAPVLKRYGKAKQATGRRSRPKHSPRRKR
jgi:two-component system sensor histidine kinase/response regulator